MGACCGLSPTAGGLESSHDTIVVVVVVVVVVVIGAAMHFGMPENPGLYDILDYDNDNDGTSIPKLG